MSVWRVTFTELLERKWVELSDVVRAIVFLVLLLGTSVVATIAIIGPFTYLAVERPALCVWICRAVALIPFLCAGTCSWSRDSVLCQLPEHLP
jgi:hypothetical protein